MDGGTKHAHPAAGKLQQAESLRHSGTIAAAESVLHALLADQPNFAPAHLCLARCARSRGDRPAVLRHLEQAEPAPRTFRALYELAQEQLAAGLFTKADSSFHRALEQSPQHPLPWLGLARSARRRGDRAASLEAHRKLAALAPADPDLQAEIGNELRELGENAAAASLFARVLAMQPDHLAALLGASIQARRAGKLDLACAMLQRAVAASPDLPRPHLQLAALHRELGQLDAAASRLAPLLGRVPVLAPAWIEAGMIERARGNLDSAAAAFTHALAATPTSIEAMLNLAGTNRLQGNHEACAALQARAAALDPTHPLLLVQRAYQATQAEDHAAALTLFEQALLQSPDALPVHTATARALARCGRLPAALALLQTSETRLGPSARLAATRLNLLREAGMLRTAWTDAASVLERGTADMPLLAAVLQVLLLVGSDAQIEACLAAARPVTTADRAIASLMQGLVAGWRHDLPAALALLADAADHTPFDGDLALLRARLSLRAFDLPATAAHLHQARQRAAPIPPRQADGTISAAARLAELLQDATADPLLAHALPSLLARPPAVRIGPLRLRVAQFPHSTLAATCLLDALGAAQKLGDINLLPAAARIPRQIVQFWDQPEPPPNAVSCMQSFRDQNPDWRCRRYDSGQAALFLRQHYGEAAALAFANATDRVQQGDLFSLAYLARCGGVYAGPDSRCLAPLEALLPSGCALLLHRDETGLFSQGFIATVPDHPLLILALAQAIAALSGSPLPWLALGPGLITRSLAALLAPGERTTAAALAGIVIRSRRGLRGIVALGCQPALSQSA